MTEDQILQLVDEFRDKVAGTDFEQMRIWHGFQKGTELERTLLIRYLDRKQIDVASICRVVGFAYPKQRQLVYDARDNLNKGYPRVELELGLATHEELGLN